MKSGARALGIAESFRRETSTLCGAVSSGNGIVDEFAFAACTVGGVDATDAVLSLWEQIDRPDIQAVLISGVALAWYNILDLDRLSQHVPVPILALTYEASEGLGEAINREFEDAAASRRHDRYDALPPREAHSVNGHRIFVRIMNDNDIDSGAVLRALTRTGGRPEPVRIARLAARAADRYRIEVADETDN